MFEALRLWWHAAATRRKMDRVFKRGEDPYGYRKSPYERARLEAMAAAARLGRCRRVLEIGCAEGAFTELLLGFSEQVTALDVSAVALERARQRLRGRRAELVEADVRAWTPAGEGRYDLIVLADVLYYLDKPMVKDVFEATCARIASWAAPGGRLLLAHAFAGPEELARRRGFSERFGRLGFAPVEERVVEGGAASGGVSCLLSLLERDAQG